MLVKDVMTHSVDVIEPAAMVDHAAAMMRDHNVGALPVIENDELVGMITDRDIVIGPIAAGQDPASTSVRQVMSDKVCYCFEDQSLTDAAACMGEMHVRRLPVLDRDMRFIGIVSLGDISADGGIGMAGEALEEISSAPPQQ